MKITAPLQICLVGTVLATVTDPTNNAGGAQTNYVPYIVAVVLLILLTLAVICTRSSAGKDDDFERHSSHSQNSSGIVATLPPPSSPIEERNPALVDEEKLKNFLDSPKDSD